MNRPIFPLLVVLLALAVLSACTTMEPPDRAATVDLDTASPLLATAERLYQEEYYTAALIECIDLARKHPLMPGLTSLQNRIMMKLAEQRASAARLRGASASRQMEVDVDSRKVIPDTYGLQRSIHGEISPMRGIPSSMQKVLEKNVTVHLDGVNLKEFILAMGASENINIIADSFDQTKTMTVHAEDTPLSEILDYVSRNLGISFFVGNNIIWATPRDEKQPATPLEIRMYHLRKGISSEEIKGEREKINIVEAIKRFVPQLDGADLLFDKKAHVLIVKNIRENLAKIEDIIENLDVCPPQILIEARFISTTVSDLSELGIDWILNSPIAITKRKVLRDGIWVNMLHTQIDEGATAGFAPFPGEAQGLNFSYQGLLTDPMFKAILHALETSGKSRTLSVPKVTTVNNRPAMIRIGEDFRYFQEYDIQSIPSSVSSEGSTVYSTVLVPVGSPQLEELGIALNVTPSVGADMWTITLYMVPEISEFVKYEYYQVAGDSSLSDTATNATSMVKLPIFRRSKIETELIVQSGETVVMGGLISSSETKGEAKVPILSSIPLIGRLFRHDSIEETKQNLLIFVTASILSERGENLVPIIEEPQKTTAE